MVSSQQQPVLCSIIIINIIIIIVLHICIMQMNAYLNLLKRQCTKIINCTCTQGHWQNEVPLRERTEVTVPASAAHYDIDDQPRVSSESDSESDVTAHIHAFLIAFVNCYYYYWRNCVRIKEKYKKKKNSGNTSQK